MSLNIKTVNGLRALLLVFSITCMGTDSLDSPRSRYQDVAYNRPTFQGTRTFEWNQALGSHLAVDGNHSTIEYCTHTMDDPINWWLVDLTESFNIHGVAILNKADHADRLANFTIDVFPSDPRSTLVDFPKGFGQICTHQTNYIPDGSWGIFDCEVKGRYLRLVKYGFSYLTLCEVEVFATKGPMRFYSKISDGSATSGKTKELGKFRSAIQCAAVLLYWPMFDNFKFDSKTGSCSAINSDKSIW